jgi:subtilisin-like proprotein convertase family protein
MSKCIWRPILSLAFALALLSNSLLAQSNSANNQLIDLTPQWNLVSIQVGNFISVEDFVSSLDNPATPTANESERLIEIWSYQPSGNPNIPGTWQTYQPKVAGFPSDLSTLQPGRGYWVNVSQFAQARLTGARWDGSVSLQTGWNLVGFPGLSLTTDEAQDLTSVFGLQLSRIPQLWTFDTSLQRFSGYDITAVPQLKELNLIKPALGYWVYALEPIVITAQPYVALPGDADASPLEPEVAFNAVEFPALPNPAQYVGTQIRKVRNASEDADFDLNGNKIIDSAFTQDTLKFDVGVDRKVITVGNNGTGLANWVLANDVPWLFTAAADAKAYPGNAGRPKTASGVVSADRDAMTLYADTTGLLPGIQTGTITMHYGSLIKVITVLLDVPVSSGDWKGYATTQSVNGRNVGIGAVDMGINLFMEEGSSTNFRAILNRDTSLLFPRDVFMSGVFYSRNQFSLTTNFEMPAGDRNAPPFDTFQQHGNYSTLNGAAKARADYDANSDRKLDVANPFPVPVRRQITLLGERKTPDRMEGSYIESITGLLPQSQPIYIQGYFFLDRQTFEPTKRSIFNQSTSGNPILIGSTGGVLFRETTLNVGSSVSIQGVTLTLNVTFPDPTKLTITLIGPNGQTVVIHQGGSTLPASLNLSQFNGLLGNGPWKLRVAWTPTAERGYFNSWGLNIQGLATYTVTGRVVGDLGSGLVPLEGVHVVLSGSNVIQQADTAPFAISATTTTGSTAVTVSSTATLYKDMPVSGNAAIPAGATITAVESATVVRLSAAAIASGTASTSFGQPGVFRFSGLTENNYSLDFSRPGFDNRLISFFLNNASLFIGDGAGAGIASSNSSTLTNDPIQLAQADVTEPTLRVGPFIGQEPLYTSLTALIPVTDLDDLGTIQGAVWNFGDGTLTVSDSASSSDEIALTTAKHTYQSAGTYTATLTLDGSLNDLVITSGQIHVQRMRPDATMPLTGNGQPAGQILVAGMVGAMAAPLSSVGDPVQKAEVTTLSQTFRIRQASGTYSDVPMASVPKAVVYQESKRDAGAFDLDRFVWMAQNEPSGFDRAAMQAQFPYLILPKTFSPSEEDSDFTGQLYLTGDGSVSAPYLLRAFDDLTEAEKQTFAGDNTPGTYVTYTPPQVGGVPVPERFRIVPTLGGAAFATQPNRVGDLLLQPGRVEP